MVLLVVSLEPASFNVNFVLLALLGRLKNVFEGKIVCHGNFSEQLDGSKFSHGRLVRVQASLELDTVYTCVQHIDTTTQINGKRQ